MRIEDMTCIEDSDFCYYAINKIYLSRIIKCYDLRVAINKILCNRLLLLKLLTDEITLTYRHFRCSQTQKHEK